MVLSVVAAVPGVVQLKIILATVLFHVKVVSRYHDHVLDETTLALRAALRKYLRDGDRVLDVGTGDLGCVAVYCSNLRRVEVLGVDVNEAYVRNARRVADASGKKEVRFRCSDWFSNVEGLFDIICSNVPYVPTAEGLTRKDKSRNREVWDGGPDGCRHAIHVLKKTKNHLSEGGRLLLGLNGIYVSGRADLSRTGETYGLQLESVLASAWTPAVVYVFRRSGELPRILH
jgi:methylase of polypeptide subunit release factors